MLTFEASLGEKRGGRKGTCCSLANVHLGRGEKKKEVEENLPQRPKKSLVLTHLRNTNRLGRKKGGKKE